jgi:metal-responsive CopG/Arc/MetJ family transcriptional regulator
MNTAPKMKRVNLYLAIPQMEEMLRLSTHRGRSVSELVRVAVEEYVSRETKKLNREEAA